MTPSSDETKPSVIEQSVIALTQRGTAPPAKTMVDALLEAEEEAKSSQEYPRFQDLVGTWRLGFITGMKRSQQRVGLILGAGRLIPKALNILQSYEAITDYPNLPEDATETCGTIQNQVNFGPLGLILRGPARLWPQSRILTFDFTRISLTLLGRRIYGGIVKNGKTKEAQFFQQPIKSQAFFHYFLVQPQCLAARGRGGGLALWVNINPSVEGIESGIQ